MHPQPDDETVLAARDRYLRESGFDAAEYTAPRFSVRVGPWVLRLPNPPERQVNVPRHDLHHVATGFRTDWRGEMAISAWEVGAGLGGLWVAWLICVPFFVAALALSPRRAIRAYREGRRCRSLFVDRLRYDELLALSVGALRRRIRLPVEPSLSRRLDDANPGAVGARGRRSPDPT
jgi:hypothetical protein